jgi:hypothetical protein
VKCAPELDHAAELLGTGHMSCDFYPEFLVVGRRDYLSGTLYSFLPNTFLVLCTLYVYNQHALFLAAWIRPFQTALVAKSREMYFKYTLGNEEDQ